jgi:hypothetical protein
VSINVEAAGQAIRLAINGAHGSQTSGELSRALFQRVLSLLTEQATMGEWMVAPTIGAPTHTDLRGPPTLKH